MYVNRYTLIYVHEYSNECSSGFSFIFYHNVQPLISGHSVVSYGYDGVFNTTDVSVCCCSVWGFLHLLTAIAEIDIIQHHVCTFLLNKVCDVIVQLKQMLCLVLTIFNEGAYLIFKPIFHMAFNLFQFDCEITLESVPGTNQY